MKIHKDVQQQEIHYCYYRLNMIADLLLPSGNVTLISFPIFVSLESGESDTISTSSQQRYKARHLKSQAPGQRKYFASLASTNSFRLKSLSQIKRNDKDWNQKTSIETDFYKADYYKKIFQYNKRLKAHFLKKKLNWADNFSAAVIFYNKPPPSNENGCGDAADHLTLACISASQKRL
ncbi:hypothetical protein FF38_10400 [Lucilia cuprina]|uniref:Uncharacterized protein n=1 Tax=Lucilia cuprina TaxID=7375 RepID=A0A0L0C0F5_LUCCU|nr:hypothetical protein FF38_10400 [Lucilia cuprina]